jgi:hypothetical protein
MSRGLTVVLETERIFVELTSNMKVSDVNALLDRQAKSRIFVCHSRILKSDDRIVQRNYEGFPLFVRNLDMARNGRSFSFRS